MHYILKGSEIKTNADFHTQIKQLLHFPDYYGENLDALWNCICDVKLPCTIIWENYEQSHAALGNYAVKALNVLKDAEKEIKGLTIEIR